MSAWNPEIVIGNTAFAINLYQSLREAEGNLLFAPYSISAALGMTYAGARGNTERQMAETLSFDLNQEEIHHAFASLGKRLRASQGSGSVQLIIENSLWPQIGYAFLLEFISILEECYGAKLHPVEYGNPEVARAEINNWVEEKTSGKVKDLIPPGLIDALTTLVLVNAIYFKGNWASKFDPELTKESTFWIAKEEGIDAPMMYQRGEFRYGESEGVQVLELPYEGGDVSMILLLPKEIDGLSSLEDVLSVEYLDEVIRNLWETEVDVSLPSFNMDGKFMLGGTLAAMGMSDAFGSRADFSGMDGSKKLFISEVIHKAIIEVNEEGTEAAAATAVVMARSIPPPVPTFRADHPFLLMIRENTTGSILFLGRVMDPSSEGNRSL